MTELEQAEQRADTVARIRRAPRDVCQVAVMRLHGHSLRDIAAATGLSYRQVRQLEQRAKALSLPAALETLL